VNFAEASEASWTVALPGDGTGGRGAAWQPAETTAIAPGANALFSFHTRYTSQVTARAGAGGAVAAGVGKAGVSTSVGAALGKGATALTVGPAPICPEHG